EELAGVVDLDHQVMDADLDRAQLELLELSAAAGGTRLVFLLLLKVAPLAVVNDFADGRAFVGRDLDEVEPGFAGPAKCVGGRDLTDLLPVLIDQENGGNPDLLVVAKVRRNGVNLPTNHPAARHPAAHRGVTRLFSYRPMGRFNHAKYTADLQEKIG